MTPGEGDQYNRVSTETIELPTTDTTQRALHEAVGHLYDELAAATEGEPEREQLCPEVFEAIEDLYVGTAEESVSHVEISYEVAE